MVDFFENLTNLASNIKYGFYCLNLGREQIAKLLIEKGGEVNAKGSDERTPLHQAAIYGNKIFDFNFT